MLTGMLAALNWVVSKSIDRYHPFCPLLKKWRGFQWTEECEKAFQDLKNYLVSAPILSALEVGEDLFIYLSMFEHAMNAVLLRD